MKNKWYNWPQKNTNTLNPWYKIVYRILVYPFLIVSLILFTVSYLMFTLSSYDTLNMLRDIY